MNNDVIKTKKKYRDSNIELLRIISMFMIVAHHFSVHGGFEITSVPFVNNIWLQFLASGGKIGVNVFIIISGYFLISSKKIQTKKVLKLFTQMLFYSLILFLIFVGLKIVPFNIKDLVKCILGYPMWWFAKSYLALYLIHPYINKLLNILDKNEYKKLLLISTLIWSILPTLTTISLDDGSLIWFIYVYSLGAYLKKFPIKYEVSTGKYFFITLTLYLLTFISVFIFYFIGTSISIIGQHTTYLYRMVSLPSVLISIFLFLSFTKIKINSNNIINIISSSTFGIYLIHDFSYVRHFLWLQLFKNASYSYSWKLIPYSLVVIVIVFFFSSILELIRIYIFERNYLKLLEKFSNYIDNIFNRIVDSNIFKNF